MPDSHDPTENSENADAQEKMRAALERSVAEIKTPAQARRTLDSLEKTAGDLREDDVAGAGEKAGEVPVAAPAADDQTFTSPGLRGCSPGSTIASTIAGLGNGKPT